MDKAKTAAAAAILGVAVPAYVGEIVSPVEDNLAVKWARGFGVLAVASIIGWAIRQLHPDTDTV